MNEPTPARTCDWCRGRIPDTSRVDAITCSKRCRQARHRFRTAIGGSPVAAGQPRRLAYADPPYPGKAFYYRDHPDFAGEVDHAQLVASLSADYDAWALSTSASALPDVLAVCPPGVRVAAWVRGARPNNETPFAQNAWEPVIYWGDTRRAPVASHHGETRPVAEISSDASRRPGAGHVADDGENDPSRSAAARRDASRPPGEHPAVSEDLRDASQLVDARRVDALVYTSRPRLTDPARVIGAKPATFCRWIFDLLGATSGDHFTDVYPGSGGVGRGWEAFVDQADPLPRSSTTRRVEQLDPSREYSATRSAGVERRESA